ncbi:MAG: hypothetical protein AMXMBFR64_13940 [Myxococcales bacterium]
MPRASWICALFLLLAPAVALGDVISEDVAACQDKKKGEACTDGSTKGTCEDSECCRLDYSTRKGSEPPQTVCRPCLKCTPKAAPAPDAPKKGCSAAGLSLTGGLSLLAGALLLLRLRRRA